MPIIVIFEHKCFNINLEIASLIKSTFLMLLDKRCNIIVVGLSFS